MLQDPVKLRELISQYGAMKRLDGYTPQSRGVAFNRLIAEMFDCYGIPAKVSVRSLGEIDVAFSIGGIRYVLEAKWEQKKADAGDIAKLRMRVHQRLVATLGVFVAFSGYSHEAKAGVNIGQRMDMLMLNRRHFEVMLSGLIPPEELFNLLIDKASYEGGTFYEVEELFDQPQSPPVIRFDVPLALRNPAKMTLSGVAVETVVHDLPTRYPGLTCDSQGRLLVNFPEGVAVVDVSSRVASWAVPVPDCCGHVLAADDGRIFFRRHNGVGVWNDGRLEAVAGGFSGNAILFIGQAGAIFAIDGGSSEEDNVGLVGMGTSLGESKRSQTTVRGAYLGDAVWMPSGKVAAVGSSSLEMIDIGSGAAVRHIHGLVNTFSIERCSASQVLIIANGQTVALMGIDGRTVLPLAEIGFNGSMSELSRSSTDVYYMYSTYAEGSAEPKGVVARVTLVEGSPFLL